jgi:hypothetical protein
MERDARLRHIEEAPWTWSPLRGSIFQLNSAAFLIKGISPLTFCVRQCRLINVGIKFRNPKPFTHITWIDNMGEKQISGFSEPVATEVGRRICSQK